MVEQFSADPDQLRAQAPVADRIAADVAATVQALRTALAAEGAPWGNDDAGRAYAESYLPEHRKMMADLDSLVEVLRHSGSDLRQLANNFEDKDLDGARHIGNAAEAIQHGATPTIDDARTAYPFDADAATRRTAPQPDPNSVSPASNAITPARETPTMPHNGSGEPDGEQTRNDEAARAPERNSDSGNRPEQPGTGNPGSPGPGGPPIGPVSAGHTRPASNPAATPPTSGQRAPGSTSTARTPWSRTAGAAGTAGTGPGTAGPKPPTGGPPRVTAPDDGRPGAPPRTPAARPPRKADKADDKVAQRDSGESVAARLARELAERHGVRAFGFDLPGVSEDVLTEIVATLDDVLPGYPGIRLSAVGIDDLADGEATRMDWDPRPATGRITLARRAATDRDYLAQIIAAHDVAGSLPPGYARRQVFSSIVYELGRALDAAGGFGAHRTALRALLTAYLPEHNREDRGSLNRTVSGFRQWRSKLSGRSFRDDRFEPGVALADAFTDVVLNAARAAPPAQVLHGLLVRTVGSDPVGAAHAPSRNQD